MRCSSCNKKFDYDRYYGVCPRCGCLNQRSTKRGRTDIPGASASGRSALLLGGEKRKRKTGGQALLALSLLFFVLAVAFFVSVPQAVSSSRAQELGEGLLAEPLRVKEYFIGEEFEVQNIDLMVRKCWVLSSWREPEGLDEGMKLVAVDVDAFCVSGFTGMEEPYLMVDGEYRRAIPYEQVEPYSMRLGITPMDLNDIRTQAAAYGWYVFVTEEENTEAVICFPETEEILGTKTVTKICGVRFSIEGE